MFGSVVPHHCKWVELFPFVGLEMVVQVVEWEWIFEMDVVEVVVVVEVDGRDSMESGMGDIEDFPSKDLANHVAKIVFGVDMAKVTKEGVCPN